jgi:hypothetical protein
MDRLIGWHHMHTNILRFTSILSLGQSLRVKGEDILSEPDLYLPQIAEWLGIRTDREAIEAMEASGALSLCTRGTGDSARR